MPSTYEVHAVAGRMLDRLRATTANRPGDLYSSAAFAEAARVAELLLGQSDDPDTTSPEALAETLRAGAISLSATRFSFTRRHLLDRAAGAGENAVIDHLSEIAECLVHMADLLTTRQEAPMAEVVDMSGRRRERATNS